MVVFEGWNLRIGYGYTQQKMRPACGTLMKCVEIYILHLALPNGR